VSTPPDDPELQGRLASALTVPFEGPAFRVVGGARVVHKIKFEHLFAGTGAGRFNPEGIERIYMALERETALAEFEHGEKRAGFDAALSDYYFFAVDLKLTRVDSAGKPRF
jgi:RES domain-containing protein